MMYRKAALFGDAKSADLVLSTASPVKVRSLGRAVKPFDNDLWEQSRYEIVKEGNLAKFRSSTTSAEQLLDTAEKTIIEASPRDK
jgi:ribA/ribD-fused uncharacterized protein